MTTAALPQLGTRTRASNARLFRRLLSAVPEEAGDYARGFCIELIAATLYASPRVQRKAGAAFLLLLDALNDRRAPQRREMRWRRVFALLASLAQDVPSAAIRQLLHENADLLRVDQYLGAQ